MVFIRTRRLFFIMCVFLISSPARSTPSDVNIGVLNIIPAMQSYDKQLVKPVDVMGFKLGERHARFDQVFHYFQQLAVESKRIKLTTMGITPEYRKQALITLSSEENIKNIDQILSDQKKGQHNEKSPLIIWLGYSVHGDEASGAHAAMALAYYLAANNSESLALLLSETIIVLEPVMNPDGFDRFASWINTYRGNVLNTDVNHIEHHQPWRTGRTNHWGFDLNRDWLLLTQAETQNRMPYFYQYQPHVVGDFHEMSAENSYFFQPGIAERTNRLTTKENQQLTAMLAGYHAQVFDRQKQLYYTRESFDDFYYGKGSTYADIVGGVGVLLEQATSKGAAHQTANGVVTFSQGVKNHFTISLSTIEGAFANKSAFINYQQAFFSQGVELAKKEDIEGYLINEAHDSSRLNLLLRNLAQQQIQAYPLTKDVEIKARSYKKEHSYFIPLAQKQYRLIKTLFERKTQFTSHSFYDVSAWSFPLAFNIHTVALDSLWGINVDNNAWQSALNDKGNVQQVMSVKENQPEPYGYLIPWDDFFAPKLLQALLSQGIHAQVATQPFTLAKNTKAPTQNNYNAGSLFIAASLQQQTNWQNIVENAAMSNNISLTPVISGYTPVGIDLGSPSFKTLSPIKVLLVGGQGVTEYESAEILFLLEQQFNIPVTVVEKSRLSTLNLAKYSHIIMIDGQYNETEAAVLTKLEKWAVTGGTIIAQNRAAKWLSDYGLLKASFISENQLNKMFDTDNLAYKDQERLASRKQISGAIVSAQLDLSHPLTYGYQQAELPLLKNNELMMKKPHMPFMTVASYGQSPLLSGYADKNLVAQLTDNAAIVAHNIGSGRIIAFSENIAFRGYWLANAKLLANSLYFSQVFDVPIH